MESNIDTAQNSDAVSRAERWRRLWHVIRWALWSWDFGVAAVLGLATTAVAFVDRTLVNRVGIDISLATIGVGTAILGVTLGALALVAALLTDAFGHVALSERGGFRRYARPFVFVASVAAATIISGLLALLLGYVLPDWSLPFGLGAITLLTAWGVLGTVQLIESIAWLGGERSKFEAALAEAGVSPARASEALAQWHREKRDAS